MFDDSKCCNASCETQECVQAEVRHTSPTRIPERLIPDIFIIRGDHLGAV